MTSYVRGIQLRLLFADGICDFVDNLAYQGRISKEEELYYYKWAGNSLGLSDLLPRGTLTLKEALIRKHGAKTMSFNRIGLLKDPDHVPPDDVITTALESSQAFGYAAVIDGQIFRDVNLEVPTLEGVRTLCETFKSAPILFQFASSDKEIKKEDVGPFILIGDESTPLMVCSVQGHFPDYARDSSPYSDAYWLVDQRLRPKMMKLYNKMCSSDMDKTLEEMRSEDQVLAGELCDMLSDTEKNSMVLLAVDGKPMSFGKDEEHEWGCVYGVGSYPESSLAEGPPKKELTTMEKMKAAMGIGKPAATASPEAAKPAATGKPAIAAKPAPAAPAKIAPVLARDKDNKGFIFGKDLALEAPDASIDNKDKLSVWYTQRLGYCPVNWKDRPLAPRLNSGFLKKEEKANPPGIHTVKAREEEPLPILSKNERAEISGTFIPKILGHNSDLIQNPMTFTAEGKEPSVAHQIGKPGIKDFLYPMRARYQTCVEYPQLAQLIWRDWQNYALNLEKVIETLNAKVKTLEALPEPEKKEEPPFVPDPKKTEEPPEKVAAVAGRPHVPGRPAMRMRG